MDQFDNRENNAGEVKAAAEQAERAQEAQEQAQDVQAQDAPEDKTIAQLLFGRKKDKPKKTVKQEIKEWIVALAFALVIVFFIQTFFFRIIRVDGHSMDTTLADGERLFVWVPDTKYGDVERNIVVICHYPNRGHTFFVKRCVAIPGDTVYRENGVTHVIAADTGEDVALDERYAAYYPYGSPDDYEAYVLGEDEYFVVGDNRYNSHDSRDWNDGDTSSDVGPIGRKMIVGRVRQVIWPLSEIRTVE